MNQFNRSIVTCLSLNSTTHYICSPWKLFSCQWCSCLFRYLLDHLFSCLACWQTFACFLVHVARFNHHKNDKDVVSVYVWVWVFSWIILFILQNCIKYQRLNMDVCLTTIHKHILLELQTRSKSLLIIDTSLLTIVSTLIMLYMKVKTMVVNYLRNKQFISFLFVNANLNVWLPP